MGGCCGSGKSYHLSMLTQTYIDELRQKAVASQNRRVFNDQPFVYVRFAGGPLDGLRIRMLESTVRGSYRIGFGVVTDTGPVQVLYQCVGGSEWAFSGAELSVV